MSEALFEVMPAQPVIEKQVRVTYKSAYERDLLEAEGYIPEDSTAIVGYAVKTIRKLEG